MNRLLGLVPVILAAALWVDAAAAITIDDFTTGPISLNGVVVPTDYTGLDPAHVVGGARRISLGLPAAVGNSLSIGSHRFDFASGGTFGYFLLAYGATQPLGVDLTAGGHDRLRIYVAQSNGATSATGQLVVTDSTNHSRSYSLGAGLAALNGTSGYLELLLTGPTVDATDIRMITLDFARYPTNGSFRIESIQTAGPPIPGDYNRDGIVDAKDFFTWKAQYGAAITALHSESIIISADGNGDRKVDGLDYTIWRNLLSSGAGGIAGVPEPVGALVVLAICLPMFSRRLVLCRRNST